MRVLWDEVKNRANKKKHGIGFEEAQDLLLSSVEYLRIFDEEHSDLEDRFIAIGPIPRGIVLVVWTEIDDETVRIISARWATRAEKKRFHTYLDPRP